MKVQLFSTLLKIILSTTELVNCQLIDDKGFFDVPPEKRRTMITRALKGLSIFGKYNKRHGRPSGRYGGYKLYALENIPLSRPFVQYPFYLFVRNGACFNDLVRHSTL
jgi:hypothetical protein